MDVVKGLLLQKDMTVQELSEKTGISKRSLDPYIRGTAKWENARSNVVFKVAEALDVDPRLILHGKVRIVVEEAD